MRAVLLALAAMAGLVGSPAKGNDFDDGWQLYKAGKHTEAVAVFRKAADTGMAAAQGALGLMYAEGLGVEATKVVHPKLG